MPENVNKKGIATRLLVKSLNLQGIDAILLSGISLAAARQAVTEKFGETYCIKTIHRRRVKLEQAAREIKAFTVPKDPRADSLMYQLKTLGVELERTMDANVDKTDPSYQMLETVKKQIQSFLRRSAEYYEEVDHLGLIRYVLNTMHIRISMMHEMEMKMGMVLRDNTDNLVRMMDAIVSSIEVHQTLGLKPKFGDPTINLNVNVGAGSQVNIGNTQSERNARLDEIEKALHGLQGEERDKKLRELVFKQVGLKDASFEEIPKENRAEGDTKT
jgi:hypothetical protein